MTPDAAVLLNLLIAIGGVVLLIWACTKLAQIARNSDKQVEYAKYSADRLSDVQKLLAQQAGQRTP